MVALKVMKNQTKTEYEIIKLLREIQLFRKLNENYQKVMATITKETSETNMFIPCLLDILCPNKKRSKSHGLESYQSEEQDNTELYDLS